MALATSDDVRRWLKDPSVEDKDIAPWLEAAEERVRDRTGLDFEPKDTQVTETHTNVRQGEILTLRDRGPTEITVAVYPSADSDGTEVAEGSGWQLLRRGRLQLLFTRYELDPGLGGQAGTVEQRPGWYAKVEVAYKASGLVPARVREACACWAAHMYRTSGLATGGLSSERLGDYSWSRDSGESAVPEQVRELLGQSCQSQIRST